VRHSQEKGVVHKKKGRLTWDPGPHPRKIRTATKGGESDETSEERQSIAGRKSLVISEGGDWGGSETQEVHLLVGGTNMRNGVKKNVEKTTPVLGKKKKKGKRYRLGGEAQKMDSIRSVGGGEVLRKQPKIFMGKNRNYVPALCPLEIPRVGKNERVPERNCPPGGGRGVHTPDNFIDVEKPLRGNGKGGMNRTSHPSSDRTARFTQIRAQKMTGKG